MSYSMPAITSYSTEEYQKMLTKQNNLFAKINEHNKSRNQKCFNYFTDEYGRRGYTMYSFGGKVSDELIETLGRNPDEAEIIMLIDGGFSHFGAVCNLRDDLTFDGHVWTD